MVKFSTEARRPIEIVKELTISAAAGSHSINVFKLRGCVRVLEQVAEITQITTLTNCTNMYADLWDGTVSKPLTANGAIISGMPVGTMFTKDKDIAETYSVSDASECQVSEVTTEEEFGRPFNVTQKSGVDTFIRFNLTTTDDPILFKMLLKFIYQPLDGGCLELLL
jgi:hypothetical protein